MKSITGIQDLKPYGLDALTGEACSHGFRILTDVTAKGKSIIERTMDVKLELHDPWNTGTKDEPHIGSCMLPFEFVPPIAIFALLNDTSIVEVWLMKSGTVLGFGVEDVDQKDETRRFYEKELRKVFYSRPSDRCLHQFTGRTH